MSDIRPDRSPLESVLAQVQAVFAALPASLQRPESDPSDPLSELLQQVASASLQSTQAITALTGRQQAEPPVRSAEGLRTVREVIRELVERQTSSSTTTTQVQGLPDLSAVQQQSHQVLQVLGDLSRFESVFTSASTKQQSSEQAVQRTEPLPSTTSEQQGTAEPAEPLLLASGGTVPGSAGEPNVFTPQGTDTQPAMLTPGEEVINAESAAANRPLLKSINEARGPLDLPAMAPETQHLAEGGTADRKAQQQVALAQQMVHRATAAVPKNEDSPEHQHALRVLFSTEAVRDVTAGQWTPGGLYHVPALPADASPKQQLTHLEKLVESYATAKAQLEHLAVGGEHAAAYAEGGNELVEHARTELLRQKQEFAQQIALSVQGLQPHLPEAAPVALTGSNLGKARLTDPTSPLVDEDVRRSAQTLLAKIPSADVQTSDSNRVVVPGKGRSRLTEILDRLGMTFQPVQSNEESLWQASKEPVQSQAQTDSLSAKRYRRLSSELYLERNPVTGTVRTIGKDKVPTLSQARPLTLAGGGTVPGGRQDQQQPVFAPQGTDTQPAMLTPGEEVINADSAAANRPLLQAINEAKGPLEPVELAEHSLLSAGPLPQQPERTETEYHAEGGTVGKKDETATAGSPPSVPPRLPAPPAAPEPEPEPGPERESLKTQTEATQQSTEATERLTEAVKEQTSQRETTTERTTESTATTPVVSAATPVVPEPGQQPGPAEQQQTVSTRWDELLRQEEELIRRKEESETALLWVQEEVRAAYQARGGSAGGPGEPVPFQALQSQEQVDLKFAVEAVQSARAQLQEHRQQMVQSLAEMHTTATVAPTGEEPRAPGELAGTSDVKITTPAVRSDTTATPAPVGEEPRAPSEVLTVKSTPAESGPIVPAQQVDITTPAVEVNAGTVTTPAGQPGSVAAPVVNVGQTVLPPERTSGPQTGQSALEVPIQPAGVDITTPAVEVNTGTVNVPATGPVVATPAPEQPGSVPTEAAPASPKPATAAPATVEISTPTVEVNAGTATTATEKATERTATEIAQPFAVPGPAGVRGAEPVPARPAVIDFGEIGRNVGLSLSYLSRTIPIGSVAGQPGSATASAVGGTGGPGGPGGPGGTGGAGAGGPGGNAAGGPGGTGSALTVTSPAVTVVNTGATAAAPGGAAPGAGPQVTQWRAPNLGDELRRTTAGLSQLSASFGQITGSATVAFGVATASLGGLVRAASPAAWQTLTSSFQLLSATIGSAFMPQVVRLSVFLQDAASLVRSLDPELKQQIATWVSWGVVLTGAGAAVTRLTPLLAPLISSLGALKAASLFLLTNPLGLALAGIAAAIAGVAVVAPQAFDPLISAGREAMQVLSGLWDQLPGMFKQLVPVLQNLGKQMAPLITEGVQTAVSVIGQLMESIRPAIEPLVSGLSSLFDAFSTQFRGQIGAVMSFIGPALGGIIPAVGPVLTVLGQIAQLVGAVLKPIFQSWAIQLQVAGAVLGTLVGGLAQLIAFGARLNSAILEPLLAMATAFGTALKPALDELWQAIKDIGRALFDAFSDLRPVFTEVATWIKSTIGPALTWLATVAASVGETIGKVLGWQIKNVVSLLSLLSGGIHALAGSAASLLGINTAFTQISNRIEQAVTSLEKFKNMAQRLTSGKLAEDELRSLLTTEERRKFLETSKDPEARRKMLEQAATDARENLEAQKKAFTPEEMERRQEAVRAALERTRSSENADVRKKAIMEEFESRGLSEVAGVDVVKKVSAILGMSMGEKLSDADIEKGQGVYAEDEAIRAKLAVKVAALQAELADMSKTEPTRLERLREFQSKHAIAFSKEIQSQFGGIGDARKTFQLAALAADPIQQQILAEHRKGYRDMVQKLGSIDKKLDNSPIRPKR